MTNSSVSADDKSGAKAQAGPEKTCTLHVCTSCRPPGTPRDPLGGRPGFLFFKELRDAIANTPLNERVDVKPADCLSVCPRPCGFALSRPGAWTYLFGDQRPVESASDVIDCIDLYLQTTDGFMPRSQRPKGLRGGILGRIPPIRRA